MHLECFQSAHSDTGSAGLGWLELQGQASQQQDQGAGARWDEMDEGLRLEDKRNRQGHLITPRPECEVSEVKHF